jgi:hypothetical protein
MKHLQHISMNTGHSRRSYRDEVPDDEVRAAASALERAKHERVPLPKFGDAYALTATYEGLSALICTIWQQEVPVMTLGVACKSKSGAGLWRVLLRQPVGPPIQVDESRRPSAPWVAAGLEAAATLAPPEVLEAIGGMESVLGWAFLEMGQ